MAASGIGEGAARRFAEEGATLVLGDIDKGALDSLAGELGGMIECRETDVSDRAACEALVQAAVDRFGRIDVLVNNAGVDHLGKGRRGRLREFTKVNETDLYGVVHMSRAAIAHLRPFEGCIVNISSVSGLGGDWEPQLLLRAAKAR